MKKNDSRKAFLDFCDTVRNTEKDKDAFLDAAHLQRTERQPTFTGAQLMQLVILLSVTLLGAVGAVCAALLGSVAACAGVAIGAAVIVMLLATGIMI